MTIAGSIRPGAFAATGVLQSLSESGSKRAELETTKDKRVLDTFIALSKQGWRLAGKDKGSPSGKGIHLRGVGLMVPPVEKQSIDDYLKMMRIENIADQMKWRAVRNPVTKTMGDRTYQWNYKTGEWEDIGPVGKSSESDPMVYVTTKDKRKVKVRLSKRDAWLKRHPSAQAGVPISEGRDPQWRIRLKESLYNRIYNSMRVEDANKAGYDVIHGIQEALEEGGFELHERVFKLPSVGGWRENVQGYNWLPQWIKRHVKSDEITMYLIMPKGIQPQDTDWLQMLETKGGMEPEDAEEMVRQGQTIRKPIRPPIKKVLTQEQYRKAKLEGWTDEEIIAEGWGIPK